VDAFLLDLQIRIAPGKRATKEDARRSGIAVKGGYQWGILGRSGISLAGDVGGKKKLHTL